MAEKYEEYDKLNGVDLLEWIALKDLYPQESEMAFIVFCNRYQKDLMEKSEIYCNKFNHSEVVAEMAAKCTFDRVWKKATTFSMKKAKTKSVDNAIRIWLIAILYTQIVKFKDKTECAEPAVDEDLSLIYSVDQMVDHVCAENIETRGYLMTQFIAIESILGKLTYKHRIIYLTYKVYRFNPKKNIPRSISRKLKDELELAPSTIRVYYKQADDLVKSQLN